jgi:carbon starvation protein CstA
MAFMILVVMIGKGFNGSIHIHELGLSDFKNFHRNPEVNFLYPMMFILISCGAISGFHATQSPMMARCLTNEKQARFAFYGAMIAEGIVTMIWATAAMNYYGDVDGLNYTLTNPTHDPAWIVNEICNSWLGKVGAVIAIIGVVACPITTGDTAYRSARLTIADALNISQKSIKNRILVSLPLFALGFVLTFFLSSQFGTLWKFVGISNQILAAITLWTIAMYFAMKKQNHLIVSIPAFILTAICVTYILIAPVKAGGMSLSPNIAYLGGIIAAIATSALWYWYFRRKKK